MSGFQDLPDDEIEELLTPKKKEKQSYQIPGTTRIKKYDTSIRTYVNWFKLPHKMDGECQVPSHNEKRSPRAKAVVEIDGINVCRWCFVEKRDLP